MSARRYLNCWLAAMWLWLANRGVQYAWIRRSHAFRGLIPHFGYSERYGLRSYRSIEYRPPKGQRWTRRDFVIGFDGYWLVTSYRLVDVRRFATKEEAMHHFYQGTSTNE